MVRVSQEHLKRSSSRFIVHLAAIVVLVAFPVINAGHFGTGVRHGKSRSTGPRADLANLRLAAVLLFEPLNHCGECIEIPGRCL